MVQRYEKMPTFATLIRKIVPKMEKKQNDILWKGRGYRRILTAGISLYTNMFRRFFKASWLMALLFALTNGALATLASIKIPELSVMILQQIIDYEGIYMESLQAYGITLLEVIILFILSLTTLALASATILHLLKEHRDSGAISIPSSWWKPSMKMMGRTLKAFFITLLIGILPFLLIMMVMGIMGKTTVSLLTEHPITTCATLSVVSLVIFIFELPLFHVIMKYLMEAPCGYMKTLRNNYRHGLRHWSMMFCVFFISILLVLLASVIIMLPGNILSMANLTAHQGLLTGDPLNMPSYMTALTLITFTFTNFIQFYVNQLTLVHNYYTYGSIETKEKEMEKETENAKLNIQ